jgi:glycerol-3-phosphate dehydrogenase subunit B
VIQDEGAGGFRPPPPVPRGEGPVSGSEPQEKPGTGTGAGSFTGPVDSDVLVVGGGMAGAMAALAAREAHARVVLVRRAPGATALSSGAIGVAPDAWAAPGEPFASRLGTLEAARRIAASRPEHPYAVVGASLDALEEALAFAARELAEVLAPPGARPLQISTPYGSFVTCALAQRTMVAGDLAAAKGPLAVVGFRGHLGFDARLVAGGIARLADLGAPPAVPVEIDLFMREDASVARPHELARALEAPGAAEQAGRLLRRTLPAGAAVALFPPVLGLSMAARVAERIEAAAGLPVAETVSDVPSVPGLRLQAALDARLAAAGIEVVSGELAEATGPGAPARVGDRVIRARSWVLATGRFVGGGIARRGRLDETLLGIPVQASEDGESGAHLAVRPPTALTVRERRAPQPLLAAGICVDRLVRPLAGSGAPVHPRLFGAGAVVGGHEQAADGTGLGVAILTGWLAGRNAAAG